MADVSFDDVKKALELPEGREWDDTKLKDAIEHAINEGGELSQIVNRIKVEDLTIEKKGNSSDKENSSTTISDHDASEDENVHKSSKEDEAPVDDHWKEDYKREWREWAEQNGKIFEESKIPDDNHDISFRLYDSESKKNNNEYAAEISYKGPRNVTLKGRDGKAPDSKYFEQTVAHAMKKNGPDIEFGDIKTDEFKAKLLAACYINGANPVGNVPTEDEISKWPKELQDMVNEAKTKAAEKGPEQEKNSEAEKPKDPKESQQSQAETVKYAKAWSDVIDHKYDKPGEEMDLAAYKNLEDKAIYLAAAQMYGVKVKNAPTEEELKGVKNPETLAVMNDIKELDAVRKKMEEHKTKSPDEVLDVTMFNKKMQTYYNIAALETGTKISTTLEESDLRQQPHHLETALRRQRNEAKMAEMKTKKAQEKGVDEKTFEQNRNAYRQQRITDYIAQNKQNTH